MEGKLTKTKRTSHHTPKMKKVLKAQKKSLRRMELLMTATMSKVDDDDDDDK